MQNSITLVLSLFYQLVMIVREPGELSGQCEEEIAVIMSGPVVREGSGRFREWRPWMFLLTESYKYLGGKVSLIEQELFS